MNRAVFTIGHSNHPEDHFISLLRHHGISAVGDLRSKPYSRMSSQFNREDIQRTLHKACIAYVFLGKELGGRTEDPSCYENGKVRYDRLAQTDLFRAGLARVLEGSSKFRLALMCAEKEPLECHRFVLVSRHLEALGVSVKHILGDGKLESQTDTLERLARQLKLPEYDMFRSHRDVLEDAYQIQADRIAYSEDEIPDRSLVRSATG